MTITIEHNAYTFWDWDSIFPGETVGDAFERAGGHVTYVEPNEIVVRGLDLRQVKEIASHYNADYLGPLEIKNIDEKTLKMTTGTDLMIFRRDLV